MLCLYIFYVAKQYMHAQNQQIFGATVQNLFATCPALTKAGIRSCFVTFLKCVLERFLAVTKFVCYHWRVSEWVWIICGMIQAKKKKKNYWGRWGTVPFPLCSSQIPHWLAWDLNLCDIAWCHLLWNFSYLWICNKGDSTIYVFAVIFDNYSDFIVCGLRFLWQ